MPNLIHITTCLLCADRSKAFKVEEEGFEPPAALQNGAALQITQRLQEFQLKLLGHIQKAAEWERKALERAMKLHIEQKGPQPDPTQVRHFEAWKEFAARTACAQGSAIMQVFDTTDPAVNAMREVCRLRLNTVTRRVYFTDADILQAVQQFNLDSQLQEGIVKLICRMRDGLLEQGEYAPKFEQSVAIVT